MDITEILSRDHERLLAAARSIACCGDAGASRRMFENFRWTWTAQWRAEEAVVFDALEGDIGCDTQDVMFKCDVEHRIIRQWIGDMAQLRSGTPSWNANALALCDLVDYHVREMHNGLVPRLLRRFGPVQRRILGMRYEIRKRCLAIACRARGPEPHRPAPQTLRRTKEPPLSHEGGGSGVAGRRTG